MNNGGLKPKDEKQNNIFIVHVFIRKIAVFFYEFVSEFVYYMCKKYLSEWVIVV